jgi:hypothetical protein
VREAEAAARKVAYDKVRKEKYMFDPETQDLEEKLAATLGTKVQIERGNNGSKLVINFFTNEDLRHLLERMKSGQALSNTDSSESIETDDRSPEEKKAIETEANIYDIKNFTI